MYLDIYPHSHLDLLGGNGDKMFSMTAVALGLLILTLITYYRDGFS